MLLNFFWFENSQSNDSVRFVMASGYIPKERVAKANALESSKIKWTPILPSIDISFAFL